MLKSILQLEGVKKLKKEQLKNVDGGFTSDGGSWSCVREKDGQTATFSTGSDAVASSWSTAWVSLGWQTLCLRTSER
ncbi:hypothetical protein [uncultured Dokdonia sp.]|uniref:hypothetical protein n=1 Tax=uncultured Dokdonia sp. TaxID=575653 RepID=UPI0026153991|nr:hypothetical protein [uncultured Dokdonia sp.]